MRSLWLGSALVATAALVFACGTALDNTGAANAALDDARVEIDAADGGADAGAPLTLVVDAVPLATDGSSRQVAYASAAPLPGYAVNVPVGTKLSILVDARTRGGRPEAYLTNSAYRPVASDTTTSGTVFFQYVTTAADVGALYVVVRDARKRNGNFLISVFAEAPPPPPPPPPPEDAGTTEPPVEKDASAPPQTPPPR